jgi:hypothetical protein
VSRTVRSGARSATTPGCPSPLVPRLTPPEIARVTREAAEPTGVCVCGKGLHQCYRFCPQCGRRGRRRHRDRAWNKLYTALELVDCSAQHIGRVYGPGRVDAFRHCPICGVRLTYSVVRDPSTAPGAGPTLREGRSRSAGPSMARSRGDDPEEISHADEGDESGRRPSRRSVAGRDRRSGGPYTTASGSVFPGDRPAGLPRRCLTSFSLEARNLRLLASDRFPEFFR